MMDVCGACDGCVWGVHDYLWVLSPPHVPADLAPNTPPLCCMHPPRYWGLFGTALIALYLAAAELINDRFV